MGSYWGMNNGTLNGLRGAASAEVVLPTCDGPAVLTQLDPDSPAILPDSVIKYALQHSRAARASFQQIYPTLLPAERARLDALLESDPFNTQLVECEQRVNDNIQKAGIRRIPIRTVGRLGRKIPR